MINNINVNVMETGAVEVVSSIGKGSLSMTVIVNHKLDGSWAWTRYAVTTSDEFTAIGDTWDVERSLDDAANPLLKAMFTMATTVLSLTKPAPKAPEVIEGPEDTEAPKGWTEVEA